MKSIIELLKVMKGTDKPQQKVTAEKSNIGGESTGNSSHCQDGGGW
jgi:hypothetical protein